ncbi:MAG: hypothetical protein DLM57_17120 [Pseudonocardiales bacterium]|nr:MAG: hypothetical protein DLM57_17120 [Pseudonocardiales bacterium]
MADVHVECGELSRTLAPGETFTFGRAPSCSLCLDADDVAISRLAGRIEHDGHGWWVVNASTSRQLATVDEFGLRSVLPPGRRIAVEGTARVLVEGAEITHQLTVTAAQDVSAGAAAKPRIPEGLPTSMGESVMINPADRAALIALFAGYLEEGNRYDPYPKSYAAAAARLGLPRTTLVKRIEYLRARLTAAGVPNLTGPNALANLAEYALTTGVISRSDLALLRG